MTAVSRARRAAATASQAADAVLAWLQTPSGWIRPSAGASEHAREGSAQTHGGSQPAAEESAPLAASAAGLGPVTDAGSAPAAVIPRTQRTAAAPVERDPVPGHHHTPFRLAHTDWLHHRLLIAGPEADLAALRTAAAGAGTVPWQLDFDSVEEDLFHLLVAPPTPAGSLSAPARNLSLAGRGSWPGSCAKRRRAVMR
jgi:hypothetical protein